MSFTGRPTYTDEIAQQFGGRVRIRVCGIVVNENKILLVKHNGLGPHGFYWSPPGGGLELGETTEQCLVREIREETGINVTVGKFMFCNEYINLPLHAIELFYNCSVVSKRQPEATLGSDPELDDDNQIISEVDWFSYREILEMPINTRHHSFRYANTMDDYMALAGQLPTQLGHNME